MYMATFAVTLFNGHILTMLISELPTPLCLIESGLKTDKIRHQNELQGSS